MRVIILSLVAIIVIVAVVAAIYWMFYKYRINKRLLEDKKHSRRLLSPLAFTVIIAFIVFSACVGIAISLFYNFYILTDRTESCDGEYTTWYNRTTQITEVKHKNSRTVSRFGNRDKPLLLWSPDSHVLALSYGDDSGNRVTELINFSTGGSHGLMPFRSDIQKALGQINTEESNNTRIEVIKWLDGDNVLVEFSWPQDSFNQPSQGWLILCLSTNTIKAIATL